jgi:hypothetical protein
MAGCLLILPGHLLAQERAAAGDPAVPADAPPAKSSPSTPRRPGVDRSSVGRLFLQANPMLWPLMLWPLVICSIVTLGYVLERSMALRRDRVIPREFADRFLERLAGGKLDRDRALELCRRMIPRRRASSRWWWAPGASPARRSGKSSATTPPARSWS